MVCQADMGYSQLKIGLYLVAEWTAVQSWKTSAHNFFAGMIINSHACIQTQM